MEDHPDSPDAPDDPGSMDTLQHAVLGGPAELTSEEVSARSGFDVPWQGRMWRALGFPDVDAGAAFTAADVEALKLVGQLLDSEALDEETVLRMTRAVGASLSRLADWEVSALTTRLESIEAGPQATGSRRETGHHLLEEVGPAFEKLLLYAWRRHLHAAVMRVEALGAEEKDLHATELTIGFADLVGFSAYSNQLSQDELGVLVEDFESRCLDVVAGNHGRVIKTLGDSVLFVSDSPDQAFDVAAEIVEQIQAAEGLPDVRIGLATGMVVLRMGDVFGPAVNLAARMTAVARRNRVITDQRTADLLPPEEFTTKVLPTRPVRGFGDVAPVSVRRRTERGAGTRPGSFSDSASRTVPGRASARAH